MNRFQVFEAFQDVILVVDQTGATVFGNGAACVLLEVNPRRLCSKKPLEQFSVFSPAIFAEPHQLSSITEVGQMRELGFTLANGKTGWVQVTVQPLPTHFIDESETIGASDQLWIVSMRDVTLEKALHTKYRGELDQKENYIRELQEARAALERHSQLLEKTVEERTRELQVANRLQKTILDSLGQGIVVFDKKGLCLPVFSRVCVQLFGKEPTGQPIEKFLGLNEKAAEDFTAWSQAVFDELLDFEDMLPLALRTLRVSTINPHSGGVADRHLGFDYYPLKGADDSLQGIVMVATDRTSEITALRKAEEERALVNKVTQVVRNREAFRLFLAEARKHFELLSKPQEIEYEELARHLHTLKGGAASFSLSSLTHSCHDLETDAKAFSHEEKRAELNQLLSERAQLCLDVLDQEVSALVELLGSVIPTGDTESQMVEVESSKLRLWSDKLVQLHSLEEAREVAHLLLLECVEKQVGSVIRHLSTSLKELATQLGKELQAFEIIGDETKVPAKVVSGLIASLVHGFRNSVYHGIETAEERQLLGKPTGGTLRVRFERSADQRLMIDIEDDGRGVDPEKIRSKLREKGLDADTAASDHDVIQAILRNDFSTANEVNLVAGRGVGLAAIAGEVRSLGGKIEVHSQKGQGMKLHIEVLLPQVIDLNESTETTGKGAKRAA